MLRFKKQQPTHYYAFISIIASINNVTRQTKLLAFNATYNIALLQQSGTEQMNVVTKDVLRRAEDLVESLQF